MYSHNNWYEHNLFDRLHTPFTDLVCKFNPVKFKYMDFYSAAIFTANIIANKYDNILIGLSGGIDSEFVVKLFHDQKLPFKPIIIKTPFNITELEYAFHLCKNLNLDPIVLECNAVEFMNVYKKLIAEKLQGTGINSTYSVIACHYAYKHNSLFLIGDHFLGGNIDKIETIEASEWDFYCNVLYGDQSLNFFKYTPELSYAMFKEIDGSRLAEYKHRLYKCDFRPKINPDRPPNFHNLHHMIMKQVGTSNEMPKNTHIFGTGKEIVSLMESWNDS
jgi:hypothetical protein